MKACRAYLDAPNPTPKPVTQTLWALTDEKGKFHRYMDGQVRLQSQRPGGIIFDGHTYVPRRVRVTIEPVKGKAGKA